MPIRNGGLFLRETLEQILGQTYDDFDILISDNDSSDETASICAEFVARDPRLRYVRQPVLLSATDNFIYVFRHTTGEYFLWAAHDDRRSPDWLSSVVEAALSNPDASLVFTRAYDDADLTGQHRAPLTYPFTTTADTSFIERLQRLARFNSRTAHFYGLYRRSALDGWYWQELEFGWDPTLLAYVAMQGNFIRADTGEFYYYRPTDRRAKTPKQRAADMFYRKGKRHIYARRSWAITKAGCAGAARHGARHSVWLTFLRLHISYVLLPLAKRYAYDHAPAFGHSLWRRIKPAG